LDGKTSIRGGFGIFYDRSETEQADQVVGMPPFAITSALGVFATGSAALGVNPSFQNPFQDVSNGILCNAPTCTTNVTNPFPYGGPTQNILFTAANGNLPVFGFCCAVVDAGARDPMADNFNLTLERQVTTDMIVSVG
jgi:hypothetical protein